MKKELNPIRQKTKDDRHIYKIDYRERRRLEMKRRIGFLHHKRACLERELKEIKQALVSLDELLQREAANEKLLNI
tara:strand:+ start:9336 stop:9563 length:228 start_codon:yes stop_codon:yes gene_type:complete